jgi:transcriptional regulator with XRE-family HTH domain
MKVTKNLNLSKNLAGNLKALRARRKLSLRALGDAAGVSGVFIWQIENGQRRTSLETVVKLAEALEVGTSDLLKTPK